MRALVAPNGFHHMGLATWSRRFPKAQVFSPEQAIARVQKKTGLQGLSPLSAAQTLSGDGLELIDLPHCKLGETLVRIRSSKGLVWFVADIVTNMPKLPDHPVGKWLFRLSGSAPGLKFNNLAGLFIVDNKRELKRWFAAKMATAAPSWLIPSHGNVVDLRSDMEPLKRVFDDS